MEIQIDLIDAEAIEATNINDLSSLKELVSSIKEGGIQEAIKVRKLTKEEADAAYKRRKTAEKERIDKAEKDGKKPKEKEIIKPEYGILDGHTRYMSAKKIGLKLIKIEELQQQSPIKEKIYAYKMNISRRDMAEWQKGEYIKAQQKETNKSVEEIAKETGWSKAYGYKLLKKLKEHQEGKQAAPVKADVAKIDSMQLDELLGRAINKIKDDNYKDTADKVSVIDDINNITKMLKQAKDYIQQDAAVKDYLKQERINKLLNNNKIEIKSLLGRQIKIDKQKLVLKSGAAKKLILPKPGTIKKTLPKIKSPFVKN